MGEDNWYRNKDWNPQIEVNFETRFKRSRKDFNKAQYLRIQATYLLKSSAKKNQEKGIQLMERLIKEYPKETFSTMNGHEQLGNYYFKNKNYQEAEHCFRVVTEYYHKYTRSGTSGIADLKLCETILQSDQTEKFEEAYMLATTKFDGTEGVLILNDHKFYHATLMANLCLRMGNLDEASEFATRALELSEITEPQFNRHKTVGIVKADTRVINRLNRIKEKSLPTNKSMDY
jgi:tetratricopeptide (TPR) repeat protein